MGTLAADARQGDTLETLAKYQLNVVVCREDSVVSTIPAITTSTQADIERNDWQTLRLRYRVTGATQEVGGDCHGKVGSSQARWPS